MTKPLTPSAARSRAARRREKAGLYCSYVDYRSELLDALVRLGWLPNKDTHSKAEIRTALSEMLDEFANSQK